MNTHWFPGIVVGALAAAFGLAASSGVEASTSEGPDTAYETSAPATGDAVADGGRSGGKKSRDDDSEESDEEGGEDEVLDEGTVTGKRPPRIRAAGEEVFSPIVTPEELEAAAALPYPLIAYRGAEVLGLPVEFIQEGREGLEYLYVRDYKAAKEHFDRIAVQHRDSSLGPIGQALIWQALMIENFDFKYTDQFRFSFEEAERRIERELDEPGNEAWEQFLLGGMKGLDAIHLMREGSWVIALERGLDAIRALRRSQELAPDFQDLQLGFGIYNYWRSVVTLSSVVLPNFGDHREEGIAQMKVAANEGIFVGPPSYLSLAFSYLEERDLKRALGYTLRGHHRYPENVINNLLLGRIYLYMRKYKQAESVFDRIREIAPENERVWYYIGLLRARTRRLEEAVEAYDRYLGFELIPVYEAAAWYRKGNAHYRLKQWKRAERAYKQAWKADHHKGAKRRLNRIKRLRRLGKIS